MRVVLFSDLHVHGFPEFGADSRLEDCISVLSDIREYCAKSRIEHVIFGGDLFHKKGIVYTRPYVRVANELLAYKEAGIAFYAVDGNHDHEDSEGAVHALQPLMAGGLIQGIGRKGWRTVSIGGVDVTLFAYCDGARTLNRRIASSHMAIPKRSGRKMAVFHHGFKGAKVGSILEYVVKEPIDARKLKLYKLYDLVFSGHYHTHQQIEGVPNGWYIGSPLEHTRSDRSVERKGFLDVDLETMAITRVPIRRPRFVTVDANDKFTKDVVAGNFVDVVYDAADERLDVRLDELRQLGARGVNPIPKPSAKKVAKKRLNVSPALAPSKVLQRYAKHQRKEIKRQRLNKKSLLELGLELIQTAEQKDK